MISAAMLAKNEEHCIGRCLESIKDLVDEIILVDTGSTDRTVEIASRYTDKIYHEPWRNDFSWHRNHSFSLCTQPWILGIDPDETFVFSNGMTRDVMLGYFDKTEKDIVSIGMEIIDWRESCNIVTARFDGLRFFRKGTVTWKRRVHNRPICDGKSVLMKDAYIKHYGYDLSAEGKKAKAERTISLLKLCLKDDPKDHESMFYLAQAYAAYAENDDKALEWANRYIDYRAESDSNFNTSIYHLAAFICQKKGLVKECNDYITRGLNEDPWDIDLLWDMIRYALSVNDRTILATAAQKFILAYENFDKYRFKHPGKFFFNYNPFSYSSALFYAAVSMLENGTIIYRKLRGFYGTLPQNAQDEINEKLAQVFNKIQFNDRVNSDYNSSAIKLSPSCFQIPQNLELPVL